MRKTLRRIVDTEGHEMKFSQGDLRISYGSIQETSESSLKTYFNSLKLKLFEIANYIPKIV